MNKQALRQQYKQLRAELPAKERLRMDDLMLLQFQQFDFSGITTLLTYWPMASMGEPNTHLFSGYLRHMIPVLQIAYPVMDTNTHSFTAHLIDESTVYHTNQWGVTEPRKANPIPPQQIDLVLVPMLVCDQQGYRVGYGKGYYDRFLPQCREDIVKIGFSYFEPVPEIEDTNQFDVPLTFCITPKHIYEF